MPRPVLSVWLVIALGTLCGADVAAQESSSAPRSVVTAASDQYQAGALHRFILGRHYRDLWQTPMAVEVLDLATFAGGLEPLRTGGGLQTQSLRFLGADGREYSFRSVDKDPSPALDPLLRETFIDDLVQDGISAAHPVGALVAAPLLDAAGVLHVDPRLMVMPDDPALGQFRAQFAGMLGLIEERPNENEGGTTSFRDAARVTSSETLVERLDRDPDNRVDAHALLTARIMDLFLGDWDRHRGQWRWATYQEDEPRSWLPVPRDRDQAFSKFDGLATRIVGLYMPQFVRFEADYPNIKRLHWSAREFDRWMLSGLNRAEWDSVGSALQARITNEVIDDAVNRLPAEIHALNADELTPALRARRDNLHEAWGDLYHILAEQVDVKATDAVEFVEVQREESGVIQVRVTAPDYGDAPYFSRTFRPDETTEVRVYLKGGDDRVVVRGPSTGQTILRFIGGSGDDTFEVHGDAAGVRFYDAHGANTAPDGMDVDTRPFDQWVWAPDDRSQPPDWGASTTPIFWTTYSSDLGFFLGGGARRESYGFRKRPFSSGVNFRGGFAPQESKGRVEVDGRIYRENSPLFFDFGVRASGLDVINYYGVGNDTEVLATDFHKVDHKSASLSTALGADLGSGVTLSGGVVFSWTDTDENDGRYFSQIRDSVYGGMDFNKVGLTARLTYDPLGESEATANRIRFDVGGTTYPQYLVDVERSFAQADASFSALLASSFYPRASLAVRGGGELVWGRFPWSRAAFLGGGENLRGWDTQRFAGDASVYLSGELRVRLGRPRVVVPVGMGAFAFTDVGRVYLDGDSPGGWHTGVGGGLWLQPVGHAYMLRWGVGVSEESTKVYLAIGLPY